MKWSSRNHIYILVYVKNFIYLDTLHDVRP